MKCIRKDITSDCLYLNVKHFSISLGPQYSGEIITIIERCAYC